MPPPLAQQCFNTGVQQKFFPGLFAHCNICKNQHYILKRPCTLDDPIYERQCELCKCNHRWPSQRVGGGRRCSDALIFNGELCGKYCTKHHKYYWKIPGETGIIMKCPDCLAKKVGATHKMYRRVDDMSGAREQERVERSLAACLRGLGQVACDLALAQHTDPTVGLFSDDATGWIDAEFYELMRAARMPLEHANYVRSFIESSFLQEFLENLRSSTAMAAEALYHTSAMPTGVIEGADSGPAITSVNIPSHGPPAVTTTTAATTVADTSTPAAVPAVPSGAAGGETKNEAARNEAAPTPMAEERGAAAETSSITLDDASAQQHPSTAAHPIPMTSEGAAPAPAPAADATGAGASQGDATATATDTSTPMQTVVAPAVEVKPVVGAALMATGPSMPAPGTGTATVVAAMANMPGGGNAHYGNVDELVVDPLFPDAAWLSHDDLAPPFSLLACAVAVDESACLNTDAITAEIAAIANGAAVSPGNEGIISLLSVMRQLLLDEKAGLFAVTLEEFRSVLKRLAVLRIINRRIPRCAQVAARSLNDRVAALRGSRVFSVRPCFDTSVQLTLYKSNDNGLSWSPAASDGHLSLVGCHDRLAVRVVNTTSRAIEFIALNMYPRPGATDGKSLELEPLSFDIDVTPRTFVLAPGAVARTDVMQLPPYRPFIDPSAKHEVAYVCLFFRFFAAGDHWFYSLPQKREDGTYRTADQINWNYLVRQYVVHFVKSVSSVQRQP